MSAVPMRPWQNALAIVAGFLVAGALLPWSLRLACALAAIGIALLLAAIRLHAHGTTSRKRRTDDVYARIASLRSARKDRLRPRR